MRNLIFLAIALSFFSCKQNPYPDVDGENSRDNRKPNGRDQQRKVPPRLSYNFPPSIDFKEGTFHKFELDIKVKAPGKAEVKVYDLPAGASFDDETFVISWKPSFFDGNNPKDPTIKQRRYPIRVWFRDVTGDEEATEQEILLIVDDVPQKFEVKGSSAVSVTEGSKLRYSFEIDNKDYPNGPFKVVTSDMPSNINLKKTSDKKYLLEFEPDYYHVNMSDSCGWNNKGCKEYLGKIIVSNPAGHQTEKEVEIKVHDKRLDSKIVTPDNLTQGLDVSFQVAAYDLNKEVTPRIEMLSGRPNFGHFKLSQKNSPENNSSVLNIEWNDIPPSHNGETITLRFKACVYDSRRNWNNCKQGSTDVTVRVKERKPPIIDRSSWMAGEVQYLGFNKREDFYISIKDGEDPKISPKVEIFPEEMRKYVSWSNNRLNLRFREKGIFQFNLVATSDYNAQSAESFIVEVFNKDRAKTLYFSDSTRDEEVQFYKKSFTKMNIMNPVIQEINMRNISERETLIIGTSILKDDTVKAKILKAMDQIDNIIVATPLVKNMPEEFLEEFRSDYQVSIKRSSDLFSADALKRMKFLNRADFSSPSAPLKLKLSASDESADPAIFQTDVRTSKCERVLQIIDEQDEDSKWEIGVICERIGRKGRFAILGTEWADLKPVENDVHLPAAWLKTMLTTRVDQEQD